FRQRFGTVRGVGRVPHVAQTLVRQLVHDRPRYGETANPGIEDPDRRIVHSASVPAAPVEYRRELTRATSHAANNPPSAPNRCPSQETPGWPGSTPHSIPPQ